MTAFKKVTKSNHLPAEGNDRFVVYSKQFNDLVDDLSQGTGDITANDVTVSGDLVVTGATTLNGTLTLGDAAADALTVNATATYSEPINYDNATTITARAAGGQASATALTAEINNVTTVATAGDSVKLPAAVAGKHVYVKNSGATALDIFPSTSDSIDALAVDLAIRIQPGSSIDFYAKDAIVWESNLDNSITLNSPTTVTGQLELKAAASAGNTVTTITNASQAAARTYTIPDGGANANFVLSEGNATINGVKTFGDVTDSTTKDTGAIILEGGIGVEKSIFAGLTINAGTSLTIGTNVTLAKEVNHTVAVTTTTTAATVGGTLQIDAGAGATTGNGGPLWLNAGASGSGATGTGGATAVSGGAASSTNGNGGNASVIGGAGSGTNQGGQGLTSGGVGGATGTGGTAKLESGAGGATSGNSGTVTILSAAETGSDSSGTVTVNTGTTDSANSGLISIVSGAVATLGNSGAVTLGSGVSTTSGVSGIVAVQTGATTIGNSGALNLTTGNAASGAAGDITLTTGTHTSTTVCPVVSLGKAVVYRPTSTAVATGATASIIGTISGSLAVTGATGAVTLPTGTEISTAIGSVTAGTYFDLIVNTIGMTAANVCTITPAAGVVTAKMVSAGDSATDQLLTVTNTSNVNIGVFRFVNIAANSWSLHRLA